MQQSIKLARTVFGCSNRGDPTPCRSHHPQHTGVVRAEYYSTLLQQKTLPFPSRPSRSPRPSGARSFRVFRGTWHPSSMFFQAQTALPSRTTPSALFPALLYDTRFPVKGQCSEMMFPRPVWPKPENDLAKRAPLCVSAPAAPHTTNVSHPMACSSSIVPAAPGAVLNGMVMQRGFSPLSYL